MRGEKKEVKAIDIQLQSVNIRDCWGLWQSGEFWTTSKVNSWYSEATDCYLSGVQTRLPDLMVVQEKTEVRFLHKPFYLF